MRASGRNRKFRNVSHVCIFDLLVGLMLTGKFSNWPFSVDSLVVAQGEKQKEFSLRHRSGLPFTSQSLQLGCVLYVAFPDVCP